jgi:tetratricopeptide (TPR) repeat protein
VLNLGGGTQQTSELAFHLYVHLFSGSFADRWPAWWKEGLAEFFSTVELGTNRARFGQSPARHVAYFREHPPMQLADLFGVGRNSLSYDEGTKSGPFFATSWLLVHELLIRSSQLHWVRATEFTTLLANRTDPQQALVKAFQTDATALDAELKQTARSFAFHAVQQDLESAWDTQRATTTQLAPPQVQAYLGDLLYRSQRETEAEDWFNRAIALDPQQPLPYEGLGWLRIHRNRRREAAEYFRQANHYGSKSALSYYYHAEALLQDLSPTTPSWPTRSGASWRQPSS